MNAQNENLKELFERFVSAEEAESCIEDFIEAERILNENPSPEPSEELLEAINNRIAGALRLRKEHTFRRIAYKLAPVAAVFVVLAVVSIQMLERGSKPVELVRASIIPSAIWESENIAVDDLDLAILTTEIDEVEVEVMTLELGESTGNGRSAVTELEMEFAEINTDIWEG